MRGEELGQILGSYRLDAIIGEGGMGCVYRATHVRLGRRAAVKVLSRALSADETYVARFFSEAKIVSEIGHPNIIDIIDFIDLTGPRRVAYVMELIEGPNLGALLKERALAPIQAFHAAVQLAGAVRAVHAVNVIHRDLKPDNILVVEPLDTDLSVVPSIKVLDFGIAKIGNSDAHKTGAGMILGTPAYMAPEQVVGEPVAPATDVYALGEIFYEMLTGSRVFPDEGVVALRHKLSAVPLELCYPPGLVCEAEVDALVRRCLAWDHRERPTVDAVLEELLRLLPSVPSGLDRGSRSVLPRLPSGPTSSPPSGARSGASSGQRSAASLEPSAEDIAFAAAPTLAAPRGEAGLSPAPVASSEAPVVSSEAPVASSEARASTPAAAPVASNAAPVAALLASSGSRLRVPVIVGASLGLLAAVGVLLASRSRPSEPAEARLISEAAVPAPESPPLRVDDPVKPSAAEPGAEPHPSTEAAPHPLAVPVAGAGPVPEAAPVLAEDPKRGEALRAPPLETTPRRASKKAVTTPGRSGPLKRSELGDW